MQEFFLLISIWILAYLIGAVNSSYYYIKIAKKKDIRKMHSGTAGATNAGRIVGKKGFIFIFCLDFLKGFILVLVSQEINLNQAYSILSIFFCMLGHIYPVQLKFKGGKGLSIYVGGLCILEPFLFLIALLIMIVGALIKQKIAMLVLAAITINIIFFFINPNITAKLSLLITSCLLIWCHRDLLRIKK